MQVATTAACPLAPAFDANLEGRHDAGMQIEASRPLTSY